MIEYVSRVVFILKHMSEKIQDPLFSFNTLDACNLFVTHSVWHQKVDQGKRVFEKMEGRLNEMKERRRRLIKYMFKKEDKLDQFEESYADSIHKKNLVIMRFSSSQLEDLLRSSTKNVA